MMSFDPWWLLLSLAVSGVGLVFFMYGKKQERVPQLVAGLLFMVYPYFVESLLWLVVVAMIGGYFAWTRSQQPRILRKRLCLKCGTSLLDRPVDDNGSGVCCGAGLPGVRQQLDACRGRVRLHVRSAGGDC